MVNKGLLVRLQAKPGKEKELEKFLQSALPLALEETGTESWYAIRITESTFAIFDTFANDADRDIHLNGAIAKALMEKAPDLLTSTPFIEKVDLLAVK
ncbi:antibiotic biosynthesis monooxygenase [Chitinophagaceae bacterium IBVUCB2]|nr:antibiotic biosynthesis monooxygenase [Chitinophagaceae bacterium IBVUCB2]